MHYRDLFQRYGQPSTEADFTISGHLTAPESCTLDRVIWCDKYAAELVQRFEAYAAALKEYRQALAARYADLETMPYKLRLEIVRTPANSGYHGVYFDIRMMQLFEDGTEVPQLREHFTGRERRQALERFAELAKQHPGIELKKDIDRRSWER